MKRFEHWYLSSYCVQHALLLVNMISVTCMGFSIFLTLWQQQKAIQIYHFCNFWRIFTCKIKQNWSIFTFWLNFDRNRLFSVFPCMNSELFFSVSFIWCLAGLYFVCVGDLLLQRGCSVKATHKSEINAFAGADQFACAERQDFSLTFMTHCSRPFKIFLYYAVLLSVHLFMHVT